MKYADFTLRYLTVAFKDCDMLRICCDCAAFEEHERMCVTASLLQVD